MKRIVISVVLFIIGFAGSYAFLCFHYEAGMMWAPEISVRQKFLAYIQYKALFKTIISLIAGVILGSIPLIIGRRK
ncbi:MAG: hypothetical protein K6F28_04665 [Lachnospiraceae bacterium]|nr:hypothetical protein [Lachnospiraceae bacterium]